MTTEKYVEVTHQYQTVVDDLTEAWAFIMSKIELCGPNPSVHIHPAQEGPPPILQALMGQQVQASDRRFHVLVEGSMKEAREEVPQT